MSIKNAVNELIIIDINELYIDNQC